MRCARGLVTGALIYLLSVGVLGAQPAHCYEIARDTLGEVLAGARLTLAVEAAVAPGLVSGEDLGPLEAPGAIWSALLQWEAAPSCSVAFSRAGAGEPYPAPRLAPIRISALRTAWPEEFGSRLATVAFTVLEIDDSARQIVGAEILVNADGFSFSTTETPRRLDLEGSVSHEVGHVLGLDHVCGLASGAFPDCGALPQEVRQALEEATMYPAVGVGNTWQRDLADDDRAGLEVLYGVSELAPSPPLTVRERCEAGEPVMVISTLGRISSVQRHGPTGAWSHALAPVTCADPDEVCERLLTELERWPPGERADLEVTDPRSAKRATLFGQTPAACPAPADAGVIDAGESAADAGDDAGDDAREGAAGCGCDAQLESGLPAGALCAILVMRGRRRRRCG